MGEELGDLLTYSPVKLLKIMKKNPTIIKTTRNSPKGKQQMKKYLFKKIYEGTSLVAQWLRLQAPNAGGPGSIPGQGTRSHMHAATKSSHAQLRSWQAATKEPKCRN